MRPLLVLSICISLLTGCLPSGDIILACSGVETEQVKVGRNLLEPNGKLEQKNRVIEFRAIRQNKLLKEYFDQPKYLVTADNANFDPPMVFENEFILGGSESDANSHKEFTFRKESNLLFVKEQSKIGGDSITTTFEGVCSEQSRIVK
jgi:hypothetical protein